MFTTKGSAAKPHWSPFVTKIHFKTQYQEQYFLRCLIPRGARLLGCHVARVATSKPTNAGAYVKKVLGNTMQATEFLAAVLPTHCT